MQETKIPAWSRTVDGAFSQPEMPGQFVEEEFGFLGIFRVDAGIKVHEDRDAWLGALARGPGILLESSQ